MAAPLSVACPHCQTAIKLKSAASVGKKARCPKCQQVFVVPAVEAEEDEFAGLIDTDANEFEDYGGDEEGDGDPYVDAPAGRPSAGRSKKGKKKRKSRSGGGGVVKGVLITLGVLLVLGLLGGGGYLAVAYLPMLGFGGPAPMAWLPDDTVSVVQIRVADLWHAPVLSPIKTPEISSAVTDTLSGVFGLQPEEIDQIVIGKPGSTSTTSELVTVVYCKAAFSEAQRSAITGGAPAVAYNGKEYFVRNGKPAVYLPRNDVAVFGDETRIRAAIDSGGTCAASEKFAFAHTGGDFTAAYLVESMAQSQSELPAPLIGGASMIPGAKLSQNVRSTAVSVEAGADLKIDARIVCTTAADAAAMVTEMQTSRDTKLAELRQQKSQIQPNPFIDADQMLALVESQEQMLSSMQMSSSGETARVSLTVPAQTIEALAKVMSMFSSMLPGILGGDASPTVPMPLQPPPTYPGR